MGSKPGDVLTIQVGGCDGKENDEAEGTISITLASGKSIKLCQSVRNKESLGRSDGTHQMIWPAGRAMADFMGTSKFCDLFDNSRTDSILELGAGSGLVGLACASFLSQGGPSAQIALSDVPSAQPVLLENIRRNESLLSSNVQVSSTSLVWHSLPTKPTYKVDWILASDVLYNLTCIPDLAATIMRLSSSTTKVLLAVRWRKPEQERSFFLRTSERFRWTVIHGACRLCWNDYGNPSCDGSNRFFSQTMVGVAGVPTSIADIDEEAANRMSNEEFDFYETVQTQIYLGQSFDKESRSILSEHETKRRKKCH